MVFDQSGWDVGTETLAQHEQRNFVQHVKVLCCCWHYCSFFSSISHVLNKGFRFCGFCAEYLHVKCSKRDLLLDLIFTHSWFNFFLNVSSSSVPSSTSLLPLHLFLLSSTSTSSCSPFYFSPSLLQPPAPPPLTLLPLPQWCSSSQGPGGGLCISSLPGGHQARRTSGHVWMGPSCCQPAVQELPDPGPHYRHRVPSVPSLLLLLPCLLLSWHFLLRDTLPRCLWLFLFLPTQCKTQTRRPYRSQGELGGKTRNLIFWWVIVSSQTSPEGTYKSKQRPITCIIIFFYIFFSWKLQVYSKKKPASTFTW